MKFNNKLYKMICLSATTFVLFAQTISIAAPVATQVKKATTQATASINYLNVSPLEIVNNPAKYLNKNITFNADFVAFTSLGLDYKPAFRDGTKYIGVLIKRDDVTHNVIPLSEMKMFLSRDMAEKHVDLETGDKIKVSGTVFSTALGDPWVDIKEFTVLTQKKKEKEEK